MIALLQRVREAWVDIADCRIAQCGAGLLVLVGVKKGDTEGQAKRLATRVAHYRIFEDDAGKMNRSLIDTGGQALLVPQFTLAADTDRGNRPSFSTAADPSTGQQMFELFCAELQNELGEACPRGVFGARMQVGLINDGPVTFWLRAH